MIGVIAKPTEHDVIREFFELFKTPWEFYRQDQQYDVLICTGDGPFDARAKVILVYSGRKRHFDDQLKITVSSRMIGSVILEYQQNRIPIYGDAVTFAGKTNGILTDANSKECAAYLDNIDGTSQARIGYDLFDEVRRLLTVGQPPANAGVPTLELHIAFLRDLITGCGISLVEIPPVPQGFQFIACLTHDVDHPSIRLHKWDHTMVGFLLRAVFGSLVDTFLGRMSIRDAVKNWAAAIKLPFVYLGLAKDFWRDFDDRYLALERGLPSTFFLIPRKNYPGKRVDGSGFALRAVRYEAQELAGTIRKLTAAGCEIGLHGLDAWLDSSVGREELEAIRQLTGVSETGVRIHWLCHDEKSAATLEKAGAVYDSTMGYNETVGYRAGTTQAYKPLEVERLLELPMHVMDTALFYLSYLALSPRKASKRLDQMANDAARFGGCLTINWHDRSLAPERLWCTCYRNLIQDLERRGAWFSTASQAISWFRKRRSVIFEADSTEPGAVRAKLGLECGDNLPNLRLRIYEARKSSLIGRQKYVDTVVGECANSFVPSETGR